MTQEFKSIEEIKEGLAMDYGFSIWDSLFESYDMYDQSYQNGANYILNKIKG